MSDVEPKVSRAPGSDELLRLIIQSATDFAILSMDRTGQVTGWNPGARPGPQSVWPCMKAIWRACPAMANTWRRLTDNCGWPRPVAKQLPKP